MNPLATIRMHLGLLSRPAGRTLCAFVLLCLASISLSAADNQPPAKQAFQGFLTDSLGVPLGNAAPVNLSVFFRVYKSPTGTADRIASEQQVVTVDKGHFSVLLGEGSQIGAETTLISAWPTLFTGADASDRYLGVQVSGENEISPRIRFLSTPYAQLARNANALLGANGRPVLVTTNNDSFLISSLPITATSFSGSGAALTQLNGANITSGVLGAAQIPNLDAAKITSGTMNAAQIPNLPATKITSDTFAAAQIPSLDAKKINTGIFGAAQIPSLDATKVTTGIFAAARIPDLDASKITTGDFKDALLSANVPLKDTAQTFTAKQTFSGAVDIGGQVRITAGAIKIFNQMYGIGTNNAGNPIQFIGTIFDVYARNIGLNADQWMEAAGFVLHSDQRIKSVVGASDTRADLDTIRRLRVTDYRRIDKLQAGDRLEKGFLAQQVQTVVPEAVSLGRNAVPDIYADASEIEMLADRSALRLTVGKAHGLKRGDFVRLLTEAGQQEVEVLDVPTSGSFVVGAMSAVPKHVFVYGRRVDDFMSVDYDRVYTTGIGAIQELAKRAESAEARVDSLERQVEDLRKLVSRMAGVSPGGAGAEEPAFARVNATANR